MLWRIDLLKDGVALTDRWGVIEARSQDEAATLAAEAISVSDANSLNAVPVAVKEIQSLPEGTFFMTYRRS